jgi:transposase-like protein
MIDEVTGSGAARYRRAALRGRLAAIVQQFSDPHDAEQFVARLRWPDGIACPRQDCRSTDISRLAMRNRWRCRRCARQFSVKVDSIFEDSHIGFDKWLPAIWVLAEAEGAISSCELARSLGITQKTAWLMLDRIRRAAGTEAFWRSWNSLA